MIAVLPGPSAAVVPVNPEVSIELSPTGVLKCIDVRVRVAASRDHARPINTRSTIICGEMHCAPRVSRLRGGTKENTHREHDVDREEEDGGRALKPERDHIRNSEKRIWERALDDQRDCASVRLHDVCAENPAHVARKHENAHAD